MDDKLKEIRQQIVNTSLPLLLNNDGEDKQAKFEIILQVIRAGTITDESIYQRAYDLANSLEDETTRLDALMRLLDEVDYELSDEAKEGDYVEAQESDEGKDGMDNQANDTQEV